MTVSLCERFGKLPSELADEPADLLRMVAVVDRYRARRDPLDPLTGMGDTSG